MKYLVNYLVSGLFRSHDYEPTDYVNALAVARELSRDFQTVALVRHGRDEWGYAPVAVFDRGSRCMGAPT